MFNEAGKSIRQGAKTVGKNTPKVLKHWYNATGMKKGVHAVYNKTGMKKGVHAVYNKTGLKKLVNLTYSGYHDLKNFVSTSAKNIRNYTSDKIYNLEKAANRAIHGGADNGGNDNG